MPSSLIFAALTAAWLIVLVPMFARRRQEVSRTTDSTLAARVVRRGGDRHWVAPAEPEPDQLQEAYPMRETEWDGAGVGTAADVESGFDDEYGESQEQDDSQWRRVHSDDVRAGRRYRPGRGGFDPEAAALAARAKYARRQRIVLVMLLAVVTTALLAAIASSALWWAHGGIDLVLIGYLFYLRRQVRIEEEVRNRRLARLSNASGDEYGGHEYGEYEDYEEEYGAVRAERFRSEAGRVEHEDFDGEELGAGSRRASSNAPVRTNAIAVDLDDEDPMFDELDERTWQPYRRAVGE